MITVALISMLLSQQPAVRRTTPASDDLGMVVRQTGTVNVNCVSGCSGGGTSDGGPTTVVQGTSPWLVAGADGGAVVVQGSISATNPSVSTTGAAVPGSATLIGGTNGTNLIAPYVITTTPDAGDPGLVVRVVGGVSGGSGGAVTQGTSPWLVASSDAGILPVTVENTVTVTGTVAATQSGTWNVNNVSGTVSLPTGASTSALQTTGNSSLSSIDGKTPALGQTTMAGSSPVVIASNQSAVPVSGTVTANQGTPGSTANRWPVQMTDGTDLAQVSAAGAVLVDGSATTQPVSGTVTANAGTGTFAVSAASLPLPSGAATASNQTTLGAQTTRINDGTDTALVTAAGALVIDGSGSTQPVSGTVTVTQGTAANLNATVTGTVAATQSGTWTVRNQDGTGNALASSTAAPAGTEQALIVRNIPSGTQTISGTVTANVGTTNGLALDATIGRTQGSSTSGQTGPIVQGAVTSAAPTYSTATTNPLSLTTAGALRTDSSATTQPISGTVTANAGTGTFGTNMAQYNGTTVGAANAVHVQPGTGASFTVAQSTAASLRTQTSAESATAAAVPTNAVQAGFRDTAGNLRPGLAIDTDTSGAAIYTQGVSIVGASFGAVTQASVEATTLPGTQTGLVTRPVLKTATAVASTAVTCATTATLAPTSALASRQSLCIYNNGSNVIYVGPSSVTTSNGFPVAPGGSFCDDVNTTQTYYCIVASGTENARVLEN